MEEDQFIITKKFHDDGAAYYSVVFGWPENVKAGTTTRVFNGSLPALAFIRKELEKEKEIIIERVVYPSHVIKLLNRKTGKVVPVARIGLTHAMQEASCSWVHYCSAEVLDGTLVYYSRFEWEEVP